MDNTADLDNENCCTEVTEQNSNEHVHSSPENREQTENHSDEGKPRVIFLRLHRVLYEICMVLLVLLLLIQE